MGASTPETGAKMLSRGIEAHARKAGLLRREAKLETELADDLPAVEMDRVQIQQLLMNPMVNALDAMKEVTDRPHVLRIRTSAHEPEAVLVAVQDSARAFLRQEVRAVPACLVLDVRMPGLNGLDLEHELALTIISR